MLLLFETPAGFAIFKVLDEAKLRSCDDLFRDFETPEGASKVVKLKHFSKFADMTDALAATTAAVEGKLSKGLRKVLKKAFSSEVQEQLAVADSKLGSAIKEKLNIGCVHDSSIAELMRCVRSQFNNLVSGLPQSEMNTMALGLAHSLSRYKLKFSPDKVDTMIVQAISLLDDLDKELNNYTMRCREWYGWHFPELGKIVTDNMSYARTVKTIGIRAGIAEVDLSSVLPEEVEAEVREVAEVSMGTEISNEDIENIIHLCNQIIELSEYRTQLYDYLKNRMMAIAPNLTLMVGELVGARLVAHAGSLLNLAKHPSSTVQILGAEKALFRALKTKHDTPKYGLIYHASFVGQTAPKNKGKISRMLAAKASLCARVDALGEDTEPSIGIESKAKMEARLATCDRLTRISGTGKAKAREEKYQMKSTPKQYNPGSDFTFDSSAKRKRKAQDTGGDEATPVAKKVKKEKKLEQLDESLPVVSPAVSKKVKKEKKDEEQLDESLAEASPTKKVKKEKKRKHPDLEDETLPETSPSPVKKKKKKSLA